MTHYITVDCASLRKDPILSNISLLPKWRRETVERIRHEQGKLESTAAYMMLMRLLHDHFNCDEQPSFVIGQHGKPELSFSSGRFMRPEGGCRLHFSMSHCRVAVACIISDEGAVGIDIERTGRMTQALVDHTMSDDEALLIRSSDDSDLQFTSLWTRKEALLKLTGEGITDDLKTVLHSQRMAGVLMESHDDIGRGYVCSIARRTDKGL